MPIDAQTQSVLESLPVETLMQLKQANSQRMTQQTPVGKFLTGAGRMLRGAAEGYLLTSQGRPLSQGVYTNPEQPKVLNIEVPKPGKYEPRTQDEAVEYERRINEFKDNKTSSSRLSPDDEVELYRRKKEIEFQTARDLDAIRKQNKLESPGNKNKEEKSMADELKLYKRKKQIDAYYSKDRTKIEKKKSEEQIKFDVKKESAMKEIENYFSIDDLVQDSRSKGGFVDRVSSGLNLKMQGLNQETPTGIAQSQLSTARKNLRVTIARIKDVGNLSSTEQTAAENLIPGDFDTQELTNLKKAYLYELAKASDSNDKNAIKEIINRWIADGLNSTSESKSNLSDEEAYQEYLKMSGE